MRLEIKSSVERQGEMNHEPGISLDLLANGLREQRTDGVIYNVENDRYKQKNNVDYPHQGKQTHIERVTPLLIASLLLVVTAFVQADSKFEKVNACPELLKLCQKSGY